MTKIINGLLCACAALLFLSMPICAQNGGAAASSTAATITTTADKTFLPIREETVIYSTAVLLGLGGGDLEVETRDAGDDWEITETTRFPELGVISDTAIVDKKTLRLKRAITKEFEKTVEYEIKDGKITGTETDGKKKSKTFTLETGGADVYNTRAFSFLMFKMLPLAKDFKTRLKIFDPTDKRIEETEFKVAGEETVTLEDGGVFDCYRIDTVTDDRRKKGSIWVERQTGRIIKLKGKNGIFRAEAQLQTNRKRIRL